MGRTLNGKAWRLSSAYILSPLLAAAVAIPISLSSKANRWRRWSFRHSPARPTSALASFPAGAMLTMATTMSGQDAKDAFMGNIDGPLAAMRCPPTRRRCS